MHVQHLMTAGAIGDLHVWKSYYAQMSKNGTLKPCHITSNTMVFRTINVVNTSNCEKSGIIDARIKKYSKSSKKSPACYLNGTPMVRREKEELSGRFPSFARKKIHFIEFLFDFLFSVFTSDCCKTGSQIQNCLATVGTTGAKRL